MPRTTLDITDIQQINLFAKVTGVPAKNCFCYANSLIFVVDPYAFSKAIGIKGENLKRIGYFLKKKVRIIRSPENENVERFIQAVIYPLKYKKFSNDNGNIVITASQQSKASLIGRDKCKLNQLIAIARQYFLIKGIRIV